MERDSVEPVETALTGERARRRPPQPDRSCLLRAADQRLHDARGQYLPMACSALGPRGIAGDPGARGNAVLGTVHPYRMAASASMRLPRKNAPPSGYGSPRDPITRIVASGSLSTASSWTR